MSNARVVRTATGLVLERPTGTPVIERLRLPPRQFAFSYGARNAHPDAPTYDTRLVGQYIYPHAWIGGWWHTYYGWFPHNYATRLHPNYPFHHPWVNVHQWGDRHLFNEEQRQPIKRTEAADCWWAVELSTSELPTLEVPDLSRDLPGLVPGEPPVLAISQWPNARTAQMHDQALAVLHLPMRVLAGISRRSKPESILAYAIYAARWITANRDDAWGDWPLEGLAEFKVQVHMDGGAIPIAIAQAESIPVTPD